MRLVIFDVDGTLVDSQDHIVEAQRRAFAAQGLPHPTRQRSLSVVGLSLDEAFAALVGPAGPVAGLARSYKEAWFAIRQEPGYAEHLYAGAADTIAALAAASDVILGIATGKSRKGVDRVIESCGWQGVFATVQTADEHPSKPAPSMVLAALAEARVPASAAVMIGDTTFDVAMALAAEVRPIGVAWGYHAPDALRAAGATAVVSSFATLRELAAPIPSFEQV